MSFHWPGKTVEEKKDIPNTPHFQAIVFGTRAETVGSYGPPDPPGDTYITVPHVEVYVFNEVFELEAFVSKATRENVSFVFYSVPSLGKSAVKVSLDV